MSVTGLHVTDELRDRKNLETLRKLDPDVTEIIGSAKHVTLYQFDSTTVKWARFDCEGPLFVVKRHLVRASGRLRKAGRFSLLQPRCQLVANCAVDTLRW